jgi:uncharacterized membrane protein
VRNLTTDATSQQAGHGQLSPREATIRRVFRWSLIIKAIDSAIEVAGGLALYFIANTTIIAVASWLTSSELVEDPRDFLANWLMHSVEVFSMTQKKAAALYLFSHGAIKLFLVIMVLRDKAWAYPLFMIALAILIAYQTYQITFAFSLWLVVLTVFDVVVLALTWHEWKLHKKVRSAS